jgi:hypothetical protein
LMCWRLLSARIPQFFPVRCFGLARLAQQHSGQSEHTLPRSRRFKSTCRRATRSC